MSSSGYQAACALGEMKDESAVILVVKVTLSSDSTLIYTQLQR